MLSCLVSEEAMNFKLILRLRVSSSSSECTDTSSSAESMSFSDIDTDDEEEAEERRATFYNNFDEDDGDSVGDIDELDTIRLKDVDRDFKITSDLLEEKERQFGDIERRNQELEETLNVRNKRIHDLECELRKKDEENRKMAEASDNLKKQHTNKQQEFQQKQTNNEDEIKQLKQLQKEQEREIKRLQEYEQIHPALQSEAAELETRLRHSEKAKHDIEAKLARAEVNMKQLTEEIHANTIEKEELLLRLSKVAGAKLTYNNPNIADLSDDKRPTKLAEEFSELYDNEWTDAFECVSFETEEETTSYMLKLLKRAYELCRLAAQQHLTEMKTGICTLSLQVNHAAKRQCQEQSQQNKDDSKDSQILYPGVAIEFDHLQDEHKKAIIELRKFVEIKLSSEFEKIVVDEISRELSIDREKQEKLYIYIKKCVNICWAMSRAEVPVAIGFPDTQEGTYLDTNIFKPYTRSGQFIDYIVWPALYLHENGPVMCKGVAQGKA